MQDASVPKTRDLVLIGGGHAHVTVIKRFGMRPIPGVRLTVISRDILAPYSGMLPGYIAGHYSLADCHIDLLQLTKFAGGRFIHGEVKGLDPDLKQILCRNRAPINYDVTSINIGSAPDLSNLSGGQQNVIPVKPISGFVTGWRQLRERVLNASENFTIAVVGAGAGGVELTLAMQYRLQRELRQLKKKDLYLHFHLFDANPEVLVGHNRQVRTYFLRLLEQRQVSVHLQQRVKQVADGKLHTESGKTIEVNDVLWVTRASAQAWLRDTPLVLTPEGFISVDPSLQSVSHPNVFAAGDIAHVVAHPRPKAGVFAVRQGPPLSRNLRRALKNKSLLEFKPQTEFLSLISTGDKQAMASKAQWAFSGKLMWRWKNWIDCRFMKRFKQLPSLSVIGLASANEPQAHSRLTTSSPGPMLCGGCGAKVSQSVLREVIDNLEQLPRSDVIRGLNTPDDAAVLKVDGDALQVQTVDHFSAFIDDPYLFGKICAEHALNDLFAMGASPTSALAIATLPQQTETLQQRELRQLLTGALSALNPAGALLVGGHTNQGKELTLGFAVSGKVSQQGMLRKQGLQAGDRLILTKPLGTGTLFAAHQYNNANGVAIDTALNAMQLSNRMAVDIFRQHNVSGCTDVSGFALLGHLWEMLENQPLAAALTLSQLPTIDGAMESFNAGIYSSTHRQNLQLATNIENSEAFANNPLYPLLFDPQTAGGLLAGIPSHQAENCLLALWQAGYNQAAIIGEIHEASSSATITLND